MLLTDKAPSYPQTSLTPSLGKLDCPTNLVHVLTISGHRKSMSSAAYTDSPSHQLAQLAHNATSASQSVFYHKVGGPGSTNRDPQGKGVKSEYNSEGSLAIVPILCRAIIFYHSIMNPP